MKAAIISLSENGKAVSEKIARAESESLSFCRFSFYKYSDDSCISFESLKETVGSIFSKFDAIIFVCSCGIAVRMAAPYLRSKLTDPAVLAVDENGKFVVSLLSGHAGGANALTKIIAEHLGAAAVITTATDSGEKFSPDSFATANNLRVIEWDAAKLIAAKMISNGKIGFKSDFEYKNQNESFFDTSQKEIGILISYDVKLMPFEKTLHLVPMDIVIGVGCRKNTDIEDFESFVLNKLSEYGISVLRVSELCTIDIKKNERCILSFAEKYKIKLCFFTAEQLMSVQGSFTHSDFVMTTTGADNVCERSAAYGGADLIFSKQTFNGMTLAVGKKDIEIDFERKLL